MRTGFSSSAVFGATESASSDAMGCWLRSLVQDLSMYSAHSPWGAVLE
jgi:hypothetical protein